MPGERIYGQNSRISVGNGDVDVQAVDRLCPCNPAHLIYDPAVVIPTRERLLRRLGERVGARRDYLGPTAAREVTHLPAQPRQLAREVCNRREDGGEHLDTRPRELRGDQPRAIPRGEHLLNRRGQSARAGVDQLKLLLDPDRIRRRRAESTLHPSTLASQLVSTSARSGLRLRLSARRFAPFSSALGVVPGSGNSPRAVPT